MKKCVKCGRHYDDSLLVCEVCDLYLIKDVASEAKNDAIHTYRESSFDNTRASKETTRTSNRSGGRRTRILPVDEEDNLVADTTNNPSRHTVFTTSDEDAIEPVYDSSSRRTERRWRRKRQFGRRLLPVARIVVPIILIAISTIFIVSNWSKIREFLRACIIGALIGGTISTFLSLRSRRNFNPDAVTMGTIGGAVVGCILKYNFLGTTAELTELIYLLMPCVIECAGIWLILRSIFRR